MFIRIKDYRFETKELISYEPYDEIYVETQAKEYKLYLGFKDKSMAALVFTDPELRDMQMKKLDKIMGVK